MNIFSGKKEDANVSVALFFKGDKLQIDEKNYEYLSPVFKADDGQIYSFIEKDSKKDSIIFVGLGEKDKVSLEAFRNVGAKIAKNARNIKSSFKAKKYVASIDSINTDGVNLCIDKIVYAIVQGMHLGLYTFEKYKTGDKPDIENDIKFYIGLDSMDKVIKEALNVTKSIYISRDLSNEPSSVIYPKTLASNMKKHAEDAGLDVQIYEEDELEKLGLNAMLAVGKSSRNKPRLIVIRHMKGKKDSGILGLVGKGITCDTGGYSLKGSDSMHYQKMDMSGASNVFGVMLSLARNKVPKNVVAVIPSCENIITDISYKIGDVLTTMSGKTVEVLNTDAEGRLALCDAITYIIRKESVQKIINMATLTGAVGAMFSNIHTGLISNNDEFYEQFLDITEESGEKVWRLPTDKAYRGMINSDVADIKNTGGCGTITAGLFLAEFMEDKPFIHLDIASTASKNPPSCEYEYKGATGVFIRTIYEYIKSM